LEKIALAITTTYLWSDSERGSKNVKKTSNCGSWAKFRKIAEEVERVRPERALVIELVTQKWLNPKNRSKGDLGNG